jgi:hypothetical protein
LQLEAPLEAQGPLGRPLELLGLVMAAAAVVVEPSLAALVVRAILAVAVVAAGVRLEQRQPLARLAQAALVAAATSWSSQSN